MNKLCGVFLSAAETAATASATVYSRYNHSKAKSKKNMLTQIYLGYIKPFNLYFHTDGSEYGMAADTLISASTESFGFCLTYTQQACSSTGSVRTG